MLHLRDDERILMVSHDHMVGPSKRRTAPPWGSSGGSCEGQMQQSPPASKASEIGLMTRMPSPVVAQQKAPRKPTSEMTP